LGNFPFVWEAMSTANRGRLLRALVERVVINESGGKVEIHLANLDEVAGLEQQEAAE
jgi:hypothetical protein